MSSDGKNGKTAESKIIKIIRFPKMAENRPNFFLPQNPFGLCGYVFVGNKPANHNEI